MRQNGVPGAVGRGNNLKKEVRINSKGWSYEKLIIKKKGSKMAFVEEKERKKKALCA